MKVCPQCQRRLLSQASVRCNWCGKIIDDTEYQAIASAEREAYFAHQARHDAQSLASISAVNVNPDSFGFAQHTFGTSSRMPPYKDQVVPSSAQEHVSASKVGKEEAQTCHNELPEPLPESGGRGRFQHLEW